MHMTIGSHSTGKLYFHRNLQHAKRKAVKYHITFMILLLKCSLWFISPLVDFSKTVVPRVRTSIKPDPSTLENEVNETNS